LALATTACTQQVAGTARAEPQTHVFPDLDQFTETTSDVYDVPLRGGPSVEFITPTGVECRITLGGPGCSGPFSTDPYRPGDAVCSSAYSTNHGRRDLPLTYTITSFQEKCPAPKTPQDRLLPSGQKLVVDWGSESGEFTCAVGPADRVACIDGRGDHGFVIEPSGSWTF
jgi:hypothetical protein